MEHKTCLHAHPEMLFLSDIQQPRPPYHHRVEGEQVEKKSICEKWAKVGLQWKGVQYRSLGRAVICHLIFSGW